MSFLDHYQIRGALGKGAGGSILHGVHRSTHAEVAVKVAKPTHLGEYRREIFSLAGLSHPRIARVLDLGTFDERGWDGHGTGAGDRWYSMPLASGGTLQDKDPTRWSQVEAWLLDILDGLAKTHARGLVHRDIKPANILFGAPDDLQPGLMIADFGIAWDPRQITDKAAGTPGFMAPEQTKRDGHIGPWTDLHAVGMLVWWCVTGTLPFHHDNPRTHLIRSMTLDLPPLEPLFPCPDGLEAWIAACCERDIKQRLQRVSDARALLPCLRGTAPGPMIAPPPITTPELFPLLQPDPQERKAEQSLLWSAIEDGLSRTGRTIVALTGDKGAGRTSMASWAGEQAHMMGFHFVGVSHVRVLPNWVQCFMANPSDALRRHLEALELTMGAVQTIHAAKAIVEIAKDRPLVLCIQDTESVHHLLPLLEAPDAPIVVLCPSPTPFADTTIHLPPMSSASMRRVLQQRVQGQDALVEAVISQSNGNPGRAIIAMSHWLMNGPDEDATVEMGLASVVNRVLERAPSNVQGAIECAATLGERVSDEVWGTVTPSATNLEAQELLIRRGLAHSDEHHLIFAPGVRDLIIAISASRGRLGRHQQACLRQLEGTRRSTLLLDVGRHEDAAHELFRALPDVQAKEGTGSCMALLTAHEQRVSLTPSLRVAKVRYLSMSGRTEEALQLAEICLADPHNTGHTLELLRWNGFCRRRLRKNPGPVYDKLYRHAVESRGEEALVALHSMHLGFLVMNEPDRAIDVLRHVEGCSTGKPNERWIRGRLDARRAVALGDVDALLRAGQLIEATAGSDFNRLYTSWCLMAEAHQCRGDLQEARALTEKMMRMSDTHNPGRAGGFDVLTLATIEVAANHLHRARSLVEAARTRSKDPGLLRVCAHVDIVLAISVDPSAIPQALRLIEETPMAIPDPGEIRLLEQAITMDPHQHAVRELLERHQTAMAAHRANARRILGVKTS